MPTFEEVKAECLQKDVLFEDPDFPANDSVLASVDRNRQITWYRPKVRNCVLTQAASYDIYQGRVADCFFISSVNALMANDKELLNKVMPRDQGFGEGYVGIFRFTFWTFGEWKEVYVDDRLPLNGSELIYSSNKLEKDEFWVCLLEKAYAKLRGTYEDLNFGFTTNALVDLTGGVSECILLKRTELNMEELFNIMCKMWKMDTLIVVTIYEPFKGHEFISIQLQPGSMVGKEVKVRSNGLVESNSYAITSITK